MMHDVTSALAKAPAHEQMTFSAEVEVLTEGEVGAGAPTPDQDHYPALAIQKYVRARSARLSAQAWPPLRTAA